MKKKRRRFDSNPDWVRSGREKVMKEGGEDEQEEMHRREKMKEEREQN